MSIANMASKLLRHAADKRFDLNVLGERVKPEYKEVYT